MAYRCSVEPPWALEYVSPGITSLCSVEPVELLSGRVSWASLVHPEDLPGVSYEVARAVSEERPFTLAYRLLDPTSGEKWVLENGQAARNESGQAVALVGFISDITAQKHAEQMLRQSEAHYRAAVDLNPQIPWTADPQGHILEVGPRWLEQVGPDKVQRLGAAWETALHPDDLESTTRAWKASLTSGRDYDERYRLRFRDGSFRWVRSRAAPKRSDTGQILKWYGTIEDINDQVELEFDLRRAEERYALAARATGDVIWDWNLDDGSVCRVATENAMLGYPSKMFTGFSCEWWLMLVHPADSDRVRQGLREIISGEEDHWRAEYRLRKADGTYAHILDRGYLVRTEAGAPRRMVGAMEDATQRKAAQEAVRGLEVQLAELSQRATMATLAATIAHELNQPLAAAVNWIAVSQQQLKPLATSRRLKVTESLCRAESEVLRAGEIIRRMRQIVSEGRPSRQPASLQAVIATVQKLMADKRSCASVELRVEIPEEADGVYADQVQLEQLILNLVQNSCDATAEVQDPKIVIRATKDADGTLTVQVRDNGRGIPSGEEGRMFSHFARSTTGGLGVGLSISRTIVEAHGGAVWATNNDDRGASVWFTILTPDKVEDTSD